MHMRRTKMKIPQRPKVLKTVRPLRIKTARSHMTPMKTKTTMTMKYATFLMKPQKQTNTS
jgi:hypothetical protein